MSPVGEGLARRPADDNWGTERAAEFCEAIRAELAWLPALHDGLEDECEAPLEVCDIPDEPLEDPPPEWPPLELELPPVAEEVGAKRTMERKNAAIRMTREERRITHLGPGPSNAQCDGRLKIHSCRAKDLKPYLPGRRATAIRHPKRTAPLGKRI